MTGAAEPAATPGSGTDTCKKEIIPKKNHKKKQQNIQVDIEICDNIVCRWLYYFQSVWTVFPHPQDNKMQRTNLELNENKLHKVFVN